MTKSEKKEMNKAEAYVAIGHFGIAARAVSALIRAARSGKTQNEMLTLAKEWSLTNHPDFII